jgi:hypothetical protein
VFSQTTELEHTESLLRAADYSHKDIRRSSMKKKTNKTTNHTSIIQREQQNSHCCVPQEEWDVDEHEIRQQNGVLS